MKIKNRTRKILFAILVCVCSLEFLSCNSKPKFDSVGVGGDFSLQGPGNKSWQLSQNSKKINLIFFGYTSCPDFCPMTLDKYKKVNQLLGSANKDLQIVFISVDSERDSVDKLQSYVHFYTLNGLGLTGTKVEIDKVVKLFAASYQKNANSIDHSTYTYLVDDQMQTRYLFRHSDPPEKIVEIIKLLL